MQEKEDLVLDGFQFGTQNDLEIGKSEQQKIEMLESRMDYGNPSQVYLIYTKAIENRVFQTPIGYTYLQRLQNFLYENPIEGKDIRSIPLYMHYGNTVREQPKFVKPKIRARGKRKETLVTKLKISVIFNIILILLVSAMFVIALNAGNPNVLNYENALVNRYASWEEDLTEREGIVREKEKELGITGNNE